MCYVLHETLNACLTCLVLPLTIANSASVATNRQPTQLEDRNGKETAMLYPTMQSWPNTPGPGPGPMQGCNFGLKMGGTDSGGENVEPSGTETRNELSGEVRAGDPAENGFSVK